MSGNVRHHLRHILFLLFAVGPALLFAYDTGIVTLVDENGDEVLSYPAGSTLYVHVWDSDRNCCPTTYETIEVTVSSETETTGETLTLTETGVNTAEFSISFDPADIVVESISQGTMFTGNGESIFFSEYDNLQGTITISAGLLGGENPSVSGTGDLVTVEVSVVQAGETELTFDGSEIFRDPDNNDVLINETVAGLVVVE